MELSPENKFRLVNKNFLDYFDVRKDENNESNNDQYQDLIFDSKQTIIKVFDISFKRVLSQLI